MKEFTVLTINPGSSSTKMGVVKGDKVIVNREVDHHKEDFAECKTFADQEPIRMAMIRKALEEEGIALSDLDAVSGRGVGLYPCAGGTYKIDELAYEHAKNDVGGIRHPASLGIIMSYKLGQELNIPAFFVNPMPTDELCDMARVTGIPGIYRPANPSISSMRSPEAVGQFGCIPMILFAASTNSYVVVSTPANVPSASPTA